MLKETPVGRWSNYICRSCSWIKNDSAGGRCTFLRNNYIRSYARMGLLLLCSALFFSARKTGKILEILGRKLVSIPKYDKLVGAQRLVSTRPPARFLRLDTTLTGGRGSLWTTWKNGAQKALLHSSHALPSAHDRPQKLIVRDNLWCPFCHTFRNWMLGQLTVWTIDCWLVLSSLQAPSLEDQRNTSHGPWGEENVRSATNYSWLGLAYFVGTSLANEDLGHHAVKHGVDLATWQ